MKYERVLCISERSVHIIISCEGDFLPHHIFSQVINVTEMVVALVADLLFAPTAGAKIRCRRLLCTVGNY